MTNWVGVMNLTIRVVNARDINIVAKYCKIEDVSLFLVKWLDEPEKGTSNLTYKIEATETFAKWISRALGVAVVRRYSTWRTIKNEEIKFIGNSEIISDEEKQNSINILLDTLSFAKDDYLCKNIITILRRTTNE